ncbi:MAG: peptidylprolyl isomerase [Desulfobacter sp.]|nr:MAG: peptidylprolyl isomerase [Desulfobacter sp.]
MKDLVMGILFCLLAVQAAGAAGAETSDKVVAKVEGFEITEQDVAARLEQMPPQYKTAFASEEGKKKFIDQLVQERLVYLQAEKEKYDTDAQVIKQLARVKQNLMISRFITETFSKIKATEAEMKAYYEDHTAEFVDGPEVWAKHILCKTEEEANAARDRVLKGEAFEDVAKEVSTGPSGEKGGDLGWFTQGQMVPAFGSKAFSMEKDAVSEPVKTRFGYHIIKVYGKKEGETKSYEDARSDLERKLTAKKQQQHMDELIRKLKTEHPVTIY